MEKNIFLLFRANPYQKVIQILGKTLEPFTDYGHVYAYGFGDAVSQDFDVFNLIPLDDDDVCDKNKSCNDFRQGWFFIIIKYLVFHIILEVDLVMPNIIFNHFSFKSL